MIKKLIFQLGGRETNQYVRASIWKQDLSAVEATVDLVHAADGLYVGVYDFDAEGEWTVIYDTYEDNLYTVYNEDYDSVPEKIEINSEFPTDKWEDWNYDGNGRLLSVAFNIGDDATPISTYLLTFEYDVNGRISGRSIIKT